MENIATIDAALDKTSFGRFNWFLILFSGLILHNVTLESVGITFTLPILECEMHLTYRQQGVLGAVSFAGVIMSSHIWGFLADTKGRKRIMQPALLLGFVATVVSSLSTSFEMLAAMRFINGLFLSAGSATVFAYLGEFHGPSYRSFAIMATSVVCAGMAIFLPLLAWVIVNRSWSWDIPYIGITYTPWRLYMLVCGIYSVICGVAFQFLPESPKYLLNAGKADKAMEVLKRIHRINCKDQYYKITALIPENPYSIQAGHSNWVTATLRSMWQQTAPLFGHTHLFKTILVCVLQFIIYFNAQGVYMWFPYILEKMTLLSENGLCKAFDKPPQNSTVLQAVTMDHECSTQLDSLTYVHTLMLEVIYVLLLLIISLALKRFQRFTILRFILLVTSVCGASSLLANHSLVAIYLFVVYLCCGLAAIVVVAIVVDIYPTKYRAMAMCISLMFGRIGCVFGSNIMGALIDSYCLVSLMGSAGSLFVALCLTAFLPTDAANSSTQKLSDSSSS